MKIKQVDGFAFLTDYHRQRLEAIYYPTLESARQHLQEAFPNHVVVAQPGRFVVAVKDRTFQVAEFKSLLK
jgi:hypothetical protein